MAKQNRIVPMGRLEELKSEPKSGSMAYRSLDSQGTMNFDAEVRTFPSRDALKAFLEIGRGGGWAALVKDLVGKNMVAYPSYERESPDARRHEGGGNPRVSRSARDMTLKARVNALVGRGKK
jgi:hypothetical protein